MHWPDTRYQALEISCISGIQPKKYLAQPYCLGWTSLMLASRYGHLNVVKYLAENGANINAKATFGGGKFLFIFWLNLFHGNAP